MMRRTALRFAMAAAAGAWPLSPLSAAQSGQVPPDEGIFLEVPPPESAYSQALEELLVPRSAPESQRMRIKSVISLTGLFDTSQGPISVCFFDGTDALARRVAKAARAWELPATSVKFDFGDAASPRRCAAGSSAAVRISFNGIGTWSVIGLKGRFASDATMSFDQRRDWLTLNQRDFNRIVQHEFGHALGLYHEHQHPAVRCSDEIDWTKAMALYQGANYNLSEDVIRRNFEVLLTAYEASEFDEKSIMLYDIPSSIFRSELFAAGGKPACYIENRVYEISEGDVAMVREFFSADLERVRAMRLAAFEKYRSLVASTEGGDKALGLASAFYPFNDVSDAKPYVSYGQNLMQIQLRK